MGVIKHQNPSAAKEKSRKTEAVIVGMKCTDTHRLSSGKIIAQAVAALKKKTWLESARGDGRKLLGAVCQSWKGGVRVGGVGGGVGGGALKIMSAADKLRVRGSGACKVSA